MKKLGLLKIKMDKKDIDLKEIFKSHSKVPDRLITRESNWLEFKKSFNWNSKSAYAKTMAAFANNRGGYLIFGVDSSPKTLIGLSSNNFENLDEATISGYLNSIFSPEIIFKKTVYEIHNKKVGVIYIDESKNKPVIAIKTDNEVKEAEIYYRYNARSEKIKYAELKILIDKIKEQVNKDWKELFKRISKVDSSTLILDKLSSVGVRITTDSNAPQFQIKEDEVLKEFLDYKTITKKLYKRYKDFKANNKYHEIRKKIINEKNSLIYQRHLDPQNPKSAKKNFYHPDIIKEYDKFYKMHKE